MGARRALACGESRLQARVIPFAALLWRCGACTPRSVGAAATEGRSRDARARQPLASAWGPGQSSLRIALNGRTTDMLATGFHPPM